MDSTSATSTTTLSIRLTEDRKLRIDALARATGRSRNYLFTEALDSYLDEHEWELAQIDEGIREAEAGDVVAREEALAALVAAGYATREGVAQERDALQTEIPDPTRTHPLDEAR